MTKSIRDSRGRNSINLGWNLLQNQLNLTKRKRKFSEIKSL